MSTKPLPALPKDEERAELQRAPSTLAPHDSLTARTVFGLQLLLYLGAVVFFVMLYKSFLFAASAASAAVVDRRQASSSSSSRPDYYQTTPEIFPGMSFVSFHFVALSDGEARPKGSSCTASRQQ